MPAVNSLGVGSGLELGSLVDNLVAIERQTAESTLDRRQLRAEVNLSALGSLKSSVAGLASALSALTSLEIGRRIDSSYPEAVSGSASPEADLGSYLIGVDQVAVAQSLASPAASPFTDADASLGAGTLTVSMGGASVDIELAEGQDSLRAVRDAINASGLGIQAAIIQNGSEYHLLLSSTQTGTAGAMSLTATGTVDARLTSAGMDVTTAAQDAVYSVNGLGLSSSSNTVTGVLPGVTLELHGETGGESVALAVAADNDGLGKKLAAVITAYNALIKNMSALGRAGQNPGESGPLVGDASLRGLQSLTGSLFSRNVAPELAGNPFANLVAIGVSTDLSGTATLDAAALESAMAENEAGVEALVAGFATELGEQLEAYDGGSGILTHRTERLSAELRDIQDQRADMERRLSAMEERLVAKFSALDALVAQFNNTSTYLSQQLASLSAITNYRGKS